MTSQSVCDISDPSVDIDANCEKLQNGTIGIVKLELFVKGSVDDKSVDAYNPLRIKHATYDARPRIFNNKLPRRARCKTLSDPVLARTKMNSLT